MSVGSLAELMAALSAALMVVPTVPNSAALMVGLTAVGLVGPTEVH